MAEVNQALFKVLRQLGADEEQAFNGATHDDVITALRADVSGIKSDIVEMKSDIKQFKWLLGFILAGVVAVLLRLYAV